MGRLSVTGEEGEVVKDSLLAGLDQADHLGVREYTGPVGFDALDDDRAYDLGVFGSRRHLPGCASAARS